MELNPRLLKFICGTAMIIIFCNVMVNVITLYFPWIALCSLLGFFAYHGIRYLLFDNHWL